MRYRFAILVLLLALALPVHAEESDAAYNARILKALDATTDVYGREVLRHGEPSYDAVKDYLRPVRQVDWSHRYYPLVLSDIGSPLKARTLYEGSEIHLDIGQRMEGHFRMPEFSAVITVGGSAERFGSDEARLTGPGLHQSWMPIYHWSYRLNGTTYRQTVFAVEEPDAGLVVYWKIESDKPASVQIALQGADDLEVKDIRLVHKDTGDCWARFGPGAQYDSEKHMFRFLVEPGRPACMAFPNVPAPGDAVFKADPASVDRALVRCARKWRSLADSGARISVPEKRVNDAYLALLCGTATMITGDAVRYSVGNQYQREYANETPNTIITLAMLGQTDAARRLFEYHFAFETKPGTEYYSAAWRLRTACMHYVLTGDRDFLQSDLPALRSFARVITDGLAAGDHGLLPPSAYAWDHPEIKVHNFAHNAICWRALRDFGIALEMNGYRADANRYSTDAAKYRKAILAAVDKSVVKDGDQVFIPMSLLGDERPHPRLSRGEQASYYNIAITPVFWSGLFPLGSPRLSQLVAYQDHRAGIMLGLLRVGRGEAGYGYCNQDGTDDVYGYPRSLYLLSVGRVDEFLLAFYSKLAHGLARDTFVGMEGASVIPIVGEHFRRMGRPPNSFSNSNFLIMLRYMLVAEKDANEDGTYDDLLLAAATPRAWLQPGKEIRVADMPTVFGPVSYRLSVDHAGKRISGEVELQARKSPRSLVLNLRLPQGRTVRSATVNGRPLHVKEGRVSLPTNTAKMRLDIALAGR